MFENRFEEIRNFERYATSNGIPVLKFFLNVSRDEQRDRLVSRLDEQDKNWKFTMTDIEERQFWPDYMEAFEDCVNATACDNAPWAVIPADDKLNMRLIVAQLVLEQLEKMHLQWPEADPQLVDNLPSLRQQLMDD